MTQLPLSFVAEARVLPYDRTRHPAPAHDLLPVASLTDEQLLTHIADSSSLAPALRARISGPQGLAGLLGLAPEHLAHLGFSEASSARLLAAVELARRLAWRDVPEADPLSTPDALARYLFLRHASIDREIFGALLLNLRNHWLAEVEIGRGAIDRCAVEPRQVLLEALLRGATRVVLFHNHPSGTPTPSPEDLAITECFGHACQQVGLELLDHLVLGTPNRWVSIRDRAPYLFSSRQ